MAMISTLISAARAAEGWPMQRTHHLVMKKGMFQSSSQIEQVEGCRKWRKKTAFVSFTGGHILYKGT